MTHSRANSESFAAASRDPLGNELMPVLVPGPKLRRMLGISAVTLWRWRHSATAQFPSATSINGRLYFSQAEVAVWLAQQHASVNKPSA
jgi:predicted DNA-binding transcriptional regulator AlpA